MVNKGYFKLFCIQATIIVFLAACRLDQAVDPTPETIDASAIKATVVVPDEIFHVSGQGPGITKETFSLTERTRVRVNWDQTSQNLFVLVIYRENAADQNRVTFEYIVGPSHGYGDFDFEAGEYGVEIEKGDGPWEIWVQEIIFEEK